jgi:hypothetical protein
MTAPTYPNNIYTPPDKETFAKLSHLREQLQVISGWIMISNETIAYEIIMASKRLQIDLHKKYFIVTENDISKWKSFFAAYYKPPDTIEFYNSPNNTLAANQYKVDAMTMTSDGLYRVSLYATIMALYQYSVELSPNIHKILKFLLFAILLLICTSAYNSAVLYPNSISFIIYNILASILIILFLPAILLFIYANAMNISRKKYFFKIMNKMIEIASHKNKTKLITFQSKPSISNTTKGSIIVTQENHNVLGVEMQPNTSNNTFQIIKSQNSSSTLLIDQLRDSDGSNSDVSNMDLSDTNNPDNITDDHHKYVEIPVLNISEHPLNISVFMDCRNIMRNFGLRMERRLTTYLGM